MDSSTIWDRCDVLITANPTLLSSKPEGKKCVKIKTDYNDGIQGDYEYNNMLDYLSDDGNTECLAK